MRKSPTISSNAPPSDPLAPILAEHLHGQGRLRVWSLIVTILGDAVEPRGGRVQAARLSAILDRLGVGRAAQRTALSRLVADGWITRQKDPDDGRAAIYGFSDDARAEVTQAARLVYAAPGRVTGGDWIVTASDDPRGIPIGPGVGLWPAEFPPRDLGVTLRGAITHVPEGLRADAPGDGQRTEAAAIRKLADLVCATGFAADGRDAMAARTVLIHRWRRYVLRHPEWPAALADPGWPDLDLRARLAGAYALTRPASEHWLSQPGPGYRGLPAGDGKARFGPG